MNNRFDFDHVMRPDLLKQQNIKMKVTNSIVGSILFHLTRKFIGTGIKWMTAIFPKRTSLEEFQTTFFKQKYWCTQKVHFEFNRKKFLTQIDKLYILYLKRTFMFFVSCWLLLCPIFFNRNAINVIVRKLYCPFSWWKEDSSKAEEDYDYIWRRMHWRSTSY